VLLFLAYCFASSFPLTTNDDEMGASLGLQALRRSGFFRLVATDQGDIVDACGCSWWGDDEGQKGEVAELCHHHKQLARKENDEQTHQRTHCAWCDMRLIGPPEFAMDKRWVCGADCPGRPGRSEVHPLNYYVGYGRIVAVDRGRAPF
jgi:hypothetical protein